jgi:hypothetical protein
MAEPIRMCVGCRERFLQNELIRLQYDKVTKKIERFSGVGRSFYLCETCLNKGTLYKSICKVCRTTKEESQLLVKVLKETLVQ